VSPNIALFPLVYPTACKMELMRKHVAPVLKKIVNVNLLERKRPNTPARTIEGTCITPRRAKFKNRSPGNKSEDDKLIVQNVALTVIQIKTKHRRRFHNSLQCQELLTTMDVSANSGALTSTAGGGENLVFGLGSDRGTVEVVLLKNKEFSL
jgi:hypothetical protein